MPTERDYEHTRVQKSGRPSKKRPKFIGQLNGPSGAVVMDYEKMKALMEASREESLAQRKPQVKEFPKPDSRPDWKYLDQVPKERMAA